MSSSKNTLQEYFHRIKEPVPTYTTKRYNNIDHSSTWYSTIVYDEQKFESEPKNSKTLAEQDVASKVLDHLAGKTDLEIVNEKQSNTFLEPEVLEKISESKAVILVDLENRPNIAKIEVWPSKILVVGVVGHCHNLATQKLPFYKSVIKSAIKDAADHALTFISGILCIHLKKDQPIYIVSGDHYAEITAFSLRSMGKNAIHLPQLSESKILEMC